VGTENYAESAILQETEKDRRMSEDQLRLAQRPESGASQARQTY
jgi:F-type H+-transporting ATPase subunit alpha